MQWSRFLQRHSFDLLLLCLIGMIFIVPLSAGRLGIWSSLLAAFTPLAAVMALSQQRRTLYIGLALGIPASIAILQDVAGVDIFANWVVMVFPLGIYVFATLVIVARVVDEPDVDRRTIEGAMCGYLMLGYVWSIAYSVHDTLSPGAFSGGSGADGVLEFGDATYFSFVTLTTLGYGDISPLTQIGRSLAILEAITGVLYLAILVASLVGSAGRKR